MGSTRYEPIAGGSDSESCEASSGVGREDRRRAAICAVVATVVFGAAVTLTPTHVWESEMLKSKKSYKGNTSAKAGAFESDSCRVYKRTFASENAVLDAEVVYRALGLEMLNNLTYTKDGGAETCAHRELLQTNGQEPFGLHFFTSQVTDYGDVSPGAFALANAASIKTAFESSSWSQWAVPAVTFYAASLDPFLSAWETAGDVGGSSLTYKLSYYASPLDGETLYNVFLLLPYSGTTIRLIAPHAGRWQAESDEMTTDMCASSLFVNQTVKSMKAHLVDVKRRRLGLGRGGGKQSSAADADATAYPDLLVVELANPIHGSQIADVPNFIQEFAEADVPYSTSVKDANGANCSWTEFDVEKCGLATDGDQCSNDDGWSVQVKSIANGGAPHGAYSPEFYSTYVSGVHAALTGCNTGWDRFLDSHLGVWCTKPRYLDNIGPKLCRADVGYHAHAGDKSDGPGIEGSLWTAGVAGLGVEFHGYFNNKFFNESALTDLDYCTRSSTGDCVHMQC